MRSSGSRAPVESLLKNTRFFYAFLWFLLSRSKFRFFGYSIIHLCLFDTIYAILQRLFALYVVSFRASDRAGIRKKDRKDISH